MSHLHEPPRGSSLPPAAYALPGLERVRGYGQGLWPSTPIHHLIGLRSTHVGYGTAVVTIPFTSWLQHPDGTEEIGWFTSLAGGLAAYTIVAPGHDIKPVHESYSPVRHPSPDTRTLVGRAQVIRSSRMWAFTVGTVEDDQGRVVAHTEAHVNIAPVDFPWPEEPPPFAPYDPPTYPTPDPYQRPVPPECFATIEQVRNHGLLDTFPEVIRGNLAAPPLYELLGIRPIAVERGTMTSELHTSAWLQGLKPRAMPWAVGAFQTDAGGVAARTVTPEGFEPAWLHYAGSNIHAVPCDGRTLMVNAEAALEGELIIVGWNTFDGGRLIGSGRATGRLVPVRDRVVPTSRVLASVLFTDIVGSTKRAEELGDAEWSAVLREHDQIVRSALDDHGGRLIKSTGDGALATFESPTRAVECGRALCANLGQLSISIRAGIHTGECEVGSTGDISGLAVHAASRIEAAAGPGEVWVSDTTRALSAGSGLTFTDMGERELKGLDEPLRLFRLD